MWKPTKEESEASVGFKLEEEKRFVASFHYRKEIEKLH